MGGHKDIFRPTCAHRSLREPIVPSSVNLPWFDIHYWTLSTIMLQFPYLYPYLIYSIENLLIKTQGNRKMVKKSKGKKKHWEIEEIKVKSQRQEKDGSCLSH